MYGPVVDQILADEQIGTGDILWPLTDNLGSVRDIAVYDAGTDATSIANHIVYDAFGRVISETNGAVDLLFGYTGRDWDAQAELQYNRARWYDPELGQWLSEDPIGFEAGDSNVRRYVGNGVTTRVDPSGNRKLRIWRAPGDNVMIVTTNKGSVSYPTDGKDLANVLQKIADNDELITSLVIKGHGGDDMELGPDGDYLTVVDPLGNGKGRVIVVNVHDPKVNIDITDRLNKTTNRNTAVDLRGCSTRKLAPKLMKALGGEPTVHGSLTPVVSIPFTSHTIGPYYGW